MSNAENALFAAPERPRHTSAELASIIKRARDIMRKDAGLNGDLDRIPQFSWLLFLKALDAHQDKRAVTDWKQFQPLVEEPYRWRDWAAPENPKMRKTGEALQDFVNGKLLPYLRKRTGTEELDVIGTIFKDVQNRMLSGNLLREVVDQIDKVDFHLKDDVHTMAQMYESMLQEMRDAAGDSGEFYTPRPVIRFMVKMVDPKPGEIVLDPACGTGGFLVEAYKHIRENYRDQLDARKLRQLDGNLRGIDKKPLPYLLANMNLLLHGIDRPYLTRDNALAHPLAENRHNRVHVIVTNPPFGGEEEGSVPENFPSATRTGKTEWLFLQVVLERLKPGGRCAIVVPNNILSYGGIGAKVKQKLLSKCNLHTVVRLPDGVFAPYTLIPSNLLFFDNTGKTTATWFYELPLPEGRRNYTKTKPLHTEEFEPVEQWWGGPERQGRVENQFAWRVPVRQLEDSGFNLDLKNPHRADDLADHSPVELVADLIASEQEILRILEEIRTELGRKS